MIIWANELNISYDWQPILMQWHLTGIMCEDGQEQKSIWINFMYCSFGGTCCVLAAAYWTCMNMWSCLLWSQIIGPFSSALLILAVHSSCEFQVGLSDTYQCFYHIIDKNCLQGRCFIITLQPHLQASTQRSCMSLADKHPPLQNASEWKWA